ncbi:MAG: hypothetical protein MJK14_19440, partial [Rivularia sp. ALOHA_DT_140]|nr:hypothetical protein [Rivularia sp. ALOHA_DT_140]
EALRRKRKRAINSSLSPKRTTIKQRMRRKNQTTSSRKTELRKTANPSQQRLRNSLRRYRQQSQSNSSN